MLQSGVLCLMYLFVSGRRQLPFTDLMLPLNGMLKNRLYTGKFYTVVPFHVMKTYKGKYRYSSLHSSHSQLNATPSLHTSKQYPEPVWSHFGKKKISYPYWDSKPGQSGS